MLKCEYRGKGHRKMAINLEAIRRRMAELNGARKNSSVQLWKPVPGEYKIRCLPWKDVSSDQPFLERWFYYLDGQPAILAPKQFGKPDPINDLITKLFRSGKPEDKELAKKLFAKNRVYVPMIVRGEEDKGVMAWAFGVKLHQRLLSFFVDDDFGDFLDPISGFDLKVSVVKKPAAQFSEITVDIKGRPCKLHDDPEQAEKWLNSIPNLDNMYTLKSKEEIEASLNMWLNSGSTDEAGEKTKETSRGAPPPANALEELANEVKAASAKTAPPKKPQPPVRKPVVDETSSEPAKKKSLDEAFEELMNDD